ncbi:hypothetical protein AAFF_G00316190 [Aldrovandia affinis]|uniref:Uncharacterized protein n=1 Tax=Aldrovandia affinis TaxID=143900 RepID=A0AAD7SMX6_9TELE|nr:hypothetical protein AAFF_G00316190 [Aldrovandia affinis]
MIAGPEVSHLVAQYEAACGTKEGTEHTSHHEETERAQRVFFENVEKLSQAMKDMGNPFQEESRDLLSLDTKDIAHHTAAELIGTHLEKGKVRFQEFMKGLEGEEESTFYEPIKKNRVDFFRQVPASVDSSKQKVLKEDCQLFSKLFISCQSRECDLKEFFVMRTSHILLPSVMVESSTPVRNPTSLPFLRAKLQPLRQSQTPTPSSLMVQRW